MTSPTIPASPQQDIEGRSVRDVVEYSPEQVNDAWCRKILRKILQSLELQYAMQMPHRAITPDTIVFHANGEPLLISDDIDAAPAPNAHLADDLTALARVIHYAITHELSPAGPMAGRVDGYSAALVVTVDACMNPDPARRPRSVDAVRRLLGMATPGRLAGAVIVPASALQPAITPAPVERAIPDPVAAGRVDGIGAPPGATVEAHHVGRRRGRRWAVAAGGGVVALALALGFVELHDAGPTGHVVLAQASSGANAGLPAAGGAGSVGKAARMDEAAIGGAGDPTGATPSVPVPVPVPVPDPAGGAASDTARDAPGGLTVTPASNRAGSAASGGSSAGTTASGGVDQSEGVTRVAPKPASAARSVAATAQPAAPARASVPPGAVSVNASYQLQIKPWGNVYVDGVDRGVSPPLRRLALKPGRHTIRITHPNNRDSILEFESASTTSNGKIIVDFNHEAE